MSHNFTIQFTLLDGRKTRGSFDPTMTLRELKQWFLIIFVLFFPKSVSALWWTGSRSGNEKILLCGCGMSRLKSQGHVQRPAFDVKVGGRAKFEEKDFSRTLADLNLNMVQNFLEKKKNFREVIFM
jgi:hypothetical protein